MNTPPQTGNEKVLDSFKSNLNPNSQACDANEGDVV